ncbi:MAG TPA: tetratricopeptide repeat protein [Burkholderiales bacterium]|nr:tetratricopeptide repeat protein [Burkholderiales bacterium]
MAVDCFRKAIARKPHFAPAHNNLGCALRRLEKVDDAIAAYHQAIELNPNLADAYNNLGCALRKKDQQDEALRNFRKAIELKPDFADAYNNLAGALIENQPEEAAAAYRRAIEIKPDHVDAHCGLGSVLQASGKFDEASICYCEALRRKPDHAEAHLNNGFLLLTEGKLEEGWREYEWRLKSKICGIQSFKQPLWDGSPLEGRTLLVHAEQGLGDTLHFIRYLPRVFERACGTVRFETLPQLIPLLKQSSYQGLIARGSPLPAFDVHVPLLSLPRIFGTTLTSIPNEVPYLSADSQLVQKWADGLIAYDGLKVGVVWQGNPENKGDRKRSIPLEHFAPLAQVEGVRLFSLQKGPGIEQLKDLSFPVIQFDESIDTQSGPFMDTAAILKNFDLVISCDTAVAHLAAALGVSTWVALQYLPDWRWMLDREDSPWYPTVRLFRQTESGNWGNVFDRIAHELPNHVGASC